jgi:peptidoglycan/xylan/chitin deacetylase (PgdA/CDA1 family)
MVSRVAALLVTAIYCLASAAPVWTARQEVLTAFAWPERAQAAISVSFDDARDSQVDVGLAALEKAGLRATFFVVSSRLGQRPEDWRRVVAAGHEIGNHSATHPCSGNFPWARERALETYDLDEIRRELTDASRTIAQVLGVEPATYAYTCGQTFVGRGRDTRSYVPVVAELFLAGRGWLDEAPNDPAYVDLAQVFGVSMDDRTFDDLLPLLEETIDHRAWLVLGGHDIGDGPGRQVTRVATLEAVGDWVRQSKGRVWMDTVGAVARHVRAARKWQP